jgi:AcrR family transcriptional regulator
MSFSPLPTGRHGLDREVVAEHQRARIVQAMMRIVVENGFQSVTIAGLCKRARVTERAFYAHFDDLEGCFLAAYDATLERCLGSLLIAPDAPLPFDRTLRRVVKAALDAAAQHPVQAHLLLIDALTAGSRGLERSRRLTDTLQAELTRDGARGTSGTPDPLLRGLVGGLREAIAIRVATGNAGDLPRLLDPLVTWMLSYAPDGRPPIARLKCPPRAARAEAPAAPPPLAGHRYPREFVRESQRRRLMDAVASIAHERGYGGLTVSGIARRARVSHQTFYEHFSDRRHALLRTFESDAQEALEAAAAAYAANQRDWPRAVRAALAALLEWLAGRPDHARLGFVAFPAVGADAYRIRNGSLQTFASLLAPGREHAPGVASIAEEAIAGAVFAIVGEEIMKGRTALLPEILPLLAYVSLAPFVGRDVAAGLAQDGKAAGRPVAART